MICTRHHLDNEQRKLSERVVVVKLANRKVDVVASDHVLVVLAYLAHVLPLLEEGITTAILGSKGLPNLEQLTDVLGCLFEHHKSINVPGVKAHPVVSVIYQLYDELHASMHCVIVLIERVKGGLNHHI